MIKPVDYLRKKPKQRRSVRKIEFIREAVLQVLDTDSLKYTTNQIAERAGVSVGTLYEYFPDKGVLLRYVVKREISIISAQVIKLIESSKATSAKQLVDEVIDASLNAFESRHRATHQIRRLAREDKVLLKEMDSLRFSVAMQLYNRLHKLDESTYPRITDDALKASCDAFRDIVYAMELESIDSAEIAAKRSQLIIAILSVLSSK